MMLFNNTVLNILYLENIQFLILRNNATVSPKNKYPYVYFQYTQILFVC